MIKRKFAKTNVIKTLSLITISMLSLLWWQPATSQEMKGNHRR